MVGAWLGRCLQTHLPFPLGPAPNRKISCCYLLRNRLGPCGNVTPCHLLPALVRRETASSNCAWAVPRACSPRLWGIFSQDCPPKPMRYLHLGLSPKILWGIYSFISIAVSRQLSHSMWGLHPLLGTAHPQPPKPAHLSCINDIPFIFPSPWRGLGAESRAQTVSLALRECWHRDIQESRHVLPAWGSTGARHGARPEGCGMIQGTVSKRDSRRIEPRCPQISPSRRCWSDALVRQG